MGGSESGAAETPGNSDSSPFASEEITTNSSVLTGKPLQDKLDREFAQMALPAFVSLAADPLVF
jgi:hypothetical protein